MTTEELADYYAALLILQYAGRTRARGTIRALALVAVSDQVIQQVIDGFDLETAIGAQLDVLGAYRGANRVNFGLDLEKEFLAFPDVDVADPTIYHGFPDADDVDVPDWYFAFTEDVVPSGALTDPDFRQFIKFLSKVQSLNLGLGEIDAILFEFFGDYVTLDDNGDMTITYTDSPDDPNPLFKIVAFTGTFPKPAGVDVVIVGA